MISIGLDDKGTAIDVTSELATLFKDTTRFTKLAEIRMDGSGNNFSEESKNTLRAAWKEAGRPEKYFNTIALQL